MGKLMQRHTLPALLCGVAILAILAFSMPAPALTESKFSVPHPLKKEQGELKKDLAHLIPYATRISERYTDLQGQIVDIFEPSEVQDELVELSEKLEDLGWEIRFLNTAAGQNYNQVAILKTEIVAYNDTVQQIKEPISKALQQLANWKKEWRLEKEQLPQWRTGVGKDITYGSVEKTFENLEKTIDGALQLISGRLKPLLATDQQIGELQVKIHALNARLDDLTQGISKGGFRKKVPSMFSEVFYKQFNKQLWVSTWESIKTFIQDQGNLFLKRIGTILLAAAVWLVLAVGIARSGRFLEEAEKWPVFNARPVSTALFVLLTFISILVSPIPMVWEPVMRVGIIVAVMPLAAGLVQQRWVKRLVGQLAVLLLLATFFRVVNIPFPVLRLFNLAIALLVLLFYVWQSRKLRLAQKSPLLTWGLRLVGAVLLTGLVAGLIGYAPFAIYLLNSSLQTLFAVLVVWMLYLLASGVTESVFFKSPFGIIRRNASVLVERLQSLVLFFFAVLLLLYTLVAWQVFPTKAGALQSLLTLGITTGSTHITIGTVLVAVAVLYGALLASRALQAVLLQEVLPRRAMELGAQLSIARLVHYAIFFIGLLLALRVLGFSLTNLTIIGGALGVGIGFGLQAIVNNFASGLILLFERPIKVGDTIEMGGEMGEVKHLGLRSTVIETYDNAEIVVPNSDLITNQVINWTLTERRVRLKLPVGVAYGSDVARVMGILMSCANEHKQVLSEPAPRVLFLEFGDSSLNFELRGWISDFNDRRTVQSDLNQAIDRRFRRSGIEIPFPQTDLHLRSVEEAAAAVLKPTPVSEKKPDEPSE